MKNDHKTKKQLIDELTELRSQNAALEKSIAGIITYELAAEEARRYAESIVGTVREPLLVLDADLKIISANRNFYRTFKVTPGETIGSFIYDLGNKQWDIPKLRELLEEVLPEKEAFDDFEVAHNFQDIGHKIMLLNARRIDRKDIGAKMILLAIEDITERKQLENLLTESEERYRRLFETASDGIVLLEKREGKITHANPATEKMLGYTKKESIGNKLQDIGVLLDRGDFQTTMQNLNKIGILNYDDVPIETKSGQHIDTDIYLVDRARLVQCNIRDITDHKRAEEALRGSEKKYQALIETTQTGYVIIDQVGLVLDANPEYVRLTGHHDLSEIVGRSVIEWTADHEKEKNAAAVGECFKTGYIKNLEIDYVDSKGSFTPIEINATYMELEGVAQILTLCRDITDRKRAEEMLRESEEKYRGILENMDDAYYELDLNGNLVFFNEALTLKTGYSRVELMGMNYRQYISPETCKQVSRVFSEIYRTGQSVKLFDYEVIMQGGQKRNYESWANLLFDNNKKPIGFRGIARDITERKKAEERYRSIFENAQEGIFQSTDEGRFLTANRALATMLGYDSPEDLMTTVIDIPKQLYVNLEDRKVLLKMIEEQESVRGFEAQFYRKNGSMIWVSVDLQAVRDTGGRVLYYEGFNEDITIKRESIERMRKALGATVQAMAMTVETRDPYTAGHQRRVADLARSIATEMNLSVDQINGIRMAATIHDLGKISVPAEILSKPTKLTALEFSLIKTHPQSGYDILKDIDFPWPVARIVLEHHERMNGSGYPNGLTGDNILMESRIIAVADVVESMGSHRPYRPSLGIEAALEEIEKNRGTHYDNAVADACLRVFREKGYQLQ